MVGTDEFTELWRHPKNLFVSALWLAYYHQLVSLIATQCGHKLVPGVRVNENNESFEHSKRSKWIKGKTIRVKNGRSEVLPGPTYKNG